MRQHLRLPQILNPSPTIIEMDTRWLEYVKACDKLSDMRQQDSPATEHQILKQYQRTELLLQEWINISQKFKATLN